MEAYAYDVKSSLQIFRPKPPFISYPLHVWYIIQPSHPFWFDHPNNTDVMKLLVMQFSSAA
jgi:hypothetical protein